MPAYLTGVYLLLVFLNISSGMSCLLPKHFPLSVCVLVMESFQIIPDGHVHMQKCSDGETESEG